MSSPIPSFYTRVWSFAFASPVVLRDDQIPLMLYLEWTRLYHHVVWPWIEEIFECPPLLHIFPLIYTTIYIHSFLYCIAYPTTRSSLFFGFSHNPKILRFDSPCQLITVIHSFIGFDATNPIRQFPTSTPVSLTRHRAVPSRNHIWRKDPTTSIGNAARSKGQRRWEAWDVLWYVCNHLQPGCSDLIRHTTKSMVYHLSMSWDLFIHTTPST